MTDSEILMAMFLIFWGILFLAASTVVIKSFLAVFRFILWVVLFPFRILKRLSPL